jgi:hypothetical protein
MMVTLFLVSWREIFEDMAIRFYDPSAPHLQSDPDRLTATKNGLLGGEVLWVFLEASS